MNKLKVSTRLLLLVGTLSLLTLAIGALGLWAASRSNEALRSVYEDRTVPAAQLGEIKSLLLLSRLALSIAVLDGTPEVVRERTAQVEKCTRDRARLWKEYMATYLTPKEAELAKAFAADMERLDKEGLAPALAALHAGDLDEVRRLSTGPLKLLFRQAEPNIDALSRLQVDEAQQEYTAAAALYAQTRNLSLGVIAGGLLFGVLFGSAIILGLRRELGGEPAEAAALAQSVAQGQLGVAIALRPGDQSSLMAQLKLMRDSLVEVVGEVRRNADSVATASAQIAQGNGDLSGRTEEQASALQQTAASMEQLNTTVTHNAESARQASQLAQTASTVAAQGGDEVARVVQTMKQIEGASKRIADIIGVIDGIAFQTNILALNAAVEAARAGEQGRGFAVVAGEVRTLAQRCAEAAREIKSLITSSVESVERGSAQVDHAGATMSQVVEAIRRVSKLVSEISAASHEQSAGVAQVGQAMTQMDQATQQNAALVEESAAAADSLRQQADQLVKAVAVFDLAGLQPA